MPIRLEGMTLYTVKDIEELLGVGNSTVRRYISQGRLSGRKLARRWYIPGESLLEYFKQSDQEPPAALLEKLKQLELKVDQGDKKPRRKISLARLASARPEPARAAEPEENLSEVEQLLRQARRLKEEAARLERLYGTPSGQKTEQRR